MYPYGLIGNCQVSSLISQKGSIDWLCMPRPDSPPIFGRILDDGAESGGFFSIEGVDDFSAEQFYLPNTAVLITVLTLNDGSSVKITDFCPRFSQHGRMYRPNSIFRMVEPINGTVALRVRCRPVCGWEKVPVKPVRGNSHLRFDMRDDVLRLVTNMSLTHLCDETPFVLQEKICFGLTWSAGIEEDLIPLTQRFLDQTVEYWKAWVKHCSIPTLYQKETIRSALTLKLHCYEDTGAILAALTTSLPEERGGTRNWDYRYCWLRDAYFVLTAFHNLGHFEEMEGFLKFILGIAESQEHSQNRFHPVYRLDHTLPLPELEHHQWRGYATSQPVRSGNQAAEHIQNDVYGEIVLALSPIFFDERFQHLRTRDHERLLSHLGRLCAQNVSQPDAGLWELRGGWQEHTFSNLMCWAGLERLERIQRSGYLRDCQINLTSAKDIAARAVLSAVQDGSLRNSPRDASYDSALLQLAIVKFPDQELAKATVSRIHAELSLSSEPESPSAFLYRYRREDDFGKPESAFVICSFWLVQALARTGQLGSARKCMAEAMASATQLGLFAEHYHPRLRQQIGNFPQSYSHVGQINAAFSVSPAWEEIL